MYLFELIYELIKNGKNKKNKKQVDDNEQYEKCEHIFLPVDSTKKILACIKCGIIKKKS